MDYVALASAADTILKEVGTKVVVSRAGATIGNAFGIFVKSEAKNSDQGSALLAQTSVTDKALLVSGLVKEPFVGDLVLVDKVSYVVSTVEKIRPATTTLLYKLGVS